MSRIAYVDGRFVPQHHAKVAMEDRGYQFADGVYEVIALYDGRLLDAPAHLARLERSLRDISIPMPMTRAALDCVITQLIRRNQHRRNGLIYMQVTSGVALRNHLANPSKPVLTLSLNPAKYPDAHTLAQGVRVITTPDERWARCDIKSIALLANVIARKKAQAAGAREAWLVADDAAQTITEGSLSNAFIVKDGTLITHPLTHAILGGITRDVILTLAKQHGISVKESPFSLQDAYAADEAFVSGASSFVLPVTRIDDTTIAGGKVGPITQQLIAAYAAHIETQPKVMS
jgi:D-alanine transaminase